MYSKGARHTVRLRTLRGARLQQRRGPQATTSPDVGQRVLHRQWPREFVTGDAEARRVELGAALEARVLHQSRRRACGHRSHTRDSAKTANRDDLREEFSIRDTHALATKRASSICRPTLAASVTTISSSTSLASARLSLLRRLDELDIALSDGAGAGGGAHRRRAAKQGRWRRLSPKRCRCEAPWPQQWK
jgi:hypothetical protein